MHLDFCTYKGAIMQWEYLLYFSYNELWYLLLISFLYNLNYAYQFYDPKIHI